jgi:hypothetical protein
MTTNQHSSHQQVTIDHTQEPVTPLKEVNGTILKNRLKNERTMSQNADMQKRVTGTSIQQHS